jgi:hypothetical protein
MSLQAVQNFRADAKIALPAPIQMISSQRHRPSLEQPTGLFQQQPHVHVQAVFLKSPL